MFRRKITNAPSGDVLSILDGDLRAADEITARIDFGEAPDVVSLMEMMTMLGHAVTEAVTCDLQDQGHELRCDEFVALLGLVYLTNGWTHVILDNCGVDSRPVDARLLSEAREGFEQVSQALFEICTDVAADED